MGLTGAIFGNQQYCGNNRCMTLNRVNVSGVDFNYNHIYVIRYIY